MVKIKLPKFRSLPQNLNLGISETKEVREDFEKLKQQASRNQKEHQETVELLRKVSKQYEELETAYYTLLKVFAETLTKQEMLLQSYELVQNAKQELEGALETHGVERFAPIVGDSVPRDNSCVVVGNLETDALFPDSVARVISVGFRVKKPRRLLVRPTVLKSVTPQTKKPGQQVGTGIEAHNEKKSAGGEQ